MSPILGLLDRGGAVIWIIAALSIVGLAVILWKLWRLSVFGAWGGARAEEAVEIFRDNGQVELSKGGGLRLHVVRTAMLAVTDTRLTSEQAREETERVARRSLAEARRGLRVLEVISTIAPLLGLLGTVLGMIAAFQALQTSGTQADASVLAGGIWEALLTTAAGMAVAIPAALALAWFEAVIDRIASDLEDLLARVFLAQPAQHAGAAE
ncbi:MAG: MotA/TolQ/ExbB proton channel family protein [Boseongicola sp.]|nr:MotA/TolQ/ExbB proton channel family protein [Boseongicola sp.]NNL17748.1 MotA/TolQ/ExbB proton channel family protein [Boseongicola sp.]